MSASSRLQCPGRVAVYQAEAAMVGTGSEVRRTLYRRLPSRCSPWVSPKQTFNESGYAATAAGSAKDANDPRRSITESLRPREAATSVGTFACESLTLRAISEASKIRQIG